MAELDTDKKLEDHLRQMCRKAADAGAKGLSEEKKAYVKGLEDALRLVSLHRRQCMDSADDAARQARGESLDATGSVKLFQMSPEQVFKLNLDENDEDCLKQCSMEELVEAAFRFENELMAILGDENSIDWDVYADLLPKELIRVVKKSVSDICRYQT
ncbi:MAG: hypothetical protein KKE62_19585 [Proteobacteria bacterium]|nr:hypothetical protein [Pseudomonadota bacterium]MBU1390006.1 hypothetical protein [Pseudomonadota bacterium]MBU1545043.1 hypothetical protein [Pseudomonadota bacterium]MBU2480353.1 hypothetical protein [Pseudomonadota bacterium]